MLSHHKHHAPQLRLNPKSSTVCSHPASLLLPHHHGSTAARWKKVWPCQLPNGHHYKTYVNNHLVLPASPFAHPMAGIGEASAIIAVAQAGISLSMVIIAYVGEVRDAPRSVSRIGNEIKSTSGRLEEIAEIIKDNPRTRLLLDTAVGDATRCSSECELILAQVGNLLVKGGWKRDSTALSKEDIDTSVVASLRWPFLKTRLDTPRVELQSIKADLILLFNVAMARKYVLALSPMLQLLIVSDLPLPLQMSMPERYLASPRKKKRPHAGQRKQGIKLESPRTNGQGAHAHRAGVPHK